MDSGPCQVIFLGNIFWVVLGSEGRTSRRPPVGGNDFSTPSKRFRIVEAVDMCTTCAQLGSTPKQTIFSTGQALSLVAANMLWPFVTHVARHETAFPTLGKK